MWKPQHLPHRTEFSCRTNPNLLSSGSCSRQDLALVRISSHLLGPPPPPKLSDEHMSSLGLHTPNGLTKSLGGVHHVDESCRCSTAELGGESEHQIRGWFCFGLYHGVPRRHLARITADQSPPELTTVTLIEIVIHPRSEPPCIRARYRHHCLSIPPLGYTRVKLPNSAGQQEKWSYNQAVSIRASSYDPG